MDKKFAEYLLTRTKSDYNKIATDFSNKRSYLSNDITVLAEYLIPKDKLLDLGCGNGRLFELARAEDTKYVGVDISEALINIAKTKYPQAEFILVDSLKLPFPDNSFDVIFCLAVYHHLPGKEMREKFLSEAERVLKPGGKIILTVWNLRQKRAIRGRLKFFNIMRLFKLTKLAAGDIFWPFKDSRGRTVANRYLHCFSIHELRDDLISSGLQIERTDKLARGKSGRNENLLIVGKKESK